MTFEKWAGVFSGISLLLSFIAVNGGSMAAIPAFITLVVAVACWVQR